MPRERLCFSRTARRFFFYDRHGKLSKLVIYHMLYNYHIQFLYLIYFFILLLHFPTIYIYTYSLISIVKNLCKIPCVCGRKIIIRHTIGQQYFSCNGSREMGKISQQRSIEMIANTQILFSVLEYDAEEKMRMSRDNLI